MNRQAVAAIQVLCYGFITLISLIALANVFNTMSTNLMLRRREFAMLRSVGMTGRSFRLMLGYECVIYGLRSLVYGTILSLLISFAFGEVSYRTEPLTTDVTSVEISYTSGENRGHSTFLRFYRVKG